MYGDAELVLFLVLKGNSRQGWAAEKQEGRIDGALVNIADHRVDAAAEIARTATHEIVTHIMLGRKHYPGNQMMERGLTGQTVPGAVRGPNGEKNRSSACSRVGRDNEVSRKSSRNS